MSRVCVLLADGFEEIEAVTLIDVLRRAEIEVLTLGVAGLEVRGAHGLTLRADALLADHAGEAWAMVLLPGGMPGAKTLRDDSAVQALLAQQHAAGRPLAAICAAPMALGQADILQGRKATCYPGFEEQLTGAVLSQQRVVQDGHIHTSRGPATALEFALHLVAQLAGHERAEAVAAGMLVAR